MALHWPNPFAWTLARAARRLAEDAADDAALREGFAPADYAEHLLALAPRRARRGLALPMAQRPDVHRRIQNVLNPSRSRGAASLALLVPAFLLVGSAFVPALRFVLTGQAKPIRQPQETAADSYAPDVRLGKTVAGNAENGFMGRLKDGRTVEMVQISLRTPRGVEAWKPDGTLLPASRRADLPTIRPHARTILLRYRNLSPDAEGGLGSGPSTFGTDEPKELVFAGGFDRPGRKAGERESLSYIEVPKEDGDRASFTFGLTDGPWTAEATLAGTPGKKGDAGRLRDLVVAYPETATPFRRDAKGLAIQDKPGHYLHDKIVATGVAFTMGEDDALRGIRLVATLKDGKRVGPFWNDGGYRGREFKHHWYFAAPPSRIASVRIETRDVSHVEFVGVRLKPTPPR